MTFGPDFLCIGMPKAGTTWLFDQLRHHPDFWMPPSKELDYLQHQKPSLRHTVDMFHRSHKGVRERRGTRHRLSDPRDVPFLALAARIAGQCRDLEAYASLFSHKGEALSGDITPAYAALPEEVIGHVAQRFPDLRIVFFARDPVDRAWSYVCQLYREEQLSPPVLASPERFREFIQTNPALRSLSFPSRIRTRWRAAAPHLRFQTFLFDGLADRPAELRREVLTFLGANPDKPSGDLPENYNRKAGKPQPPRPDAIRDVLISHFAEELRSCATLFGGPATGWPRRYGIDT